MSRKSKCLFLLTFSSSLSSCRSTFLCLITRSVPEQWFTGRVKSSACPQTANHSRPICPHLPSIWVSVNRISMGVGVHSRGGSSSNICLQVRLPLNSTVPGVGSARMLLRGGLIHHHQRGDTCKPRTVPPTLTSRCPSPTPGKYSVRVSPSS